MHTYGGKDEIQAGGDDQEHSTLTCNGKSYNGFEKYMYVAISLKRQPQKTNNKKQENSAVADSGCTGNFNGSIFPQKQCATNNKDYQ